MRNTGLQNAILYRNPNAEQKDLPKGLRGTVKAVYCPRDETGWLLGENKEYKRVVTLDANGFVTYMHVHGG